MLVFKKVVENMESFFKEKNKKRLFDNLVIIAIVGIIIIIIGGSFSKEREKVPEEKERSAAQLTLNSKDEESNRLERELEEILSEIEGAGKVRVMVTFETTKETIHAYNTEESNSITDEKDSSGGSRKSNEFSSKKEIVFQDRNGSNNRPVVVKQIEPEIRGVVIVADGAGNIAVKQNISNAVIALLDVPAHKIQVLKRQSQRR